MNSSNCPFAERDYAALSMLTQAADAMNDQSSSSISNHFHYHQGHAVPPHAHSSRMPGAEDNTIHGDYNPSVLSARSMETLIAFDPVGGGGGRAYFNTHHQNAGQIHTGHNSNLGILSAESYDDGRGAMRATLENESRMRKQQDTTLLFGIIDAPRLEMEKEILDVERSGSGKKKRKTKHRPADALVDEIEEEEEEEEEDARKKARGRPRVDTKDETPAERRRTQIRLAQRAYRNRKETTISSLEKKVQDLRGNNEEMSNIFINLYDFAVNQGILGRDAALAHQFQSATERFVSLAKSAANDDSNPEENTSDKNLKQDSAELEPGRRTKGRKAVSKTQPQPSQVISPPTSEPASNPWGGYTITKENSPSREMELQYKPMDRSGIQIITKPTENNASFPFDFLGSEYVVPDRSNIQIISRPTEDNASFPFDLTDFQQYRAEVPPIDSFPQRLVPASYPPPPSSYAFTESSLARRIHRATTEAGFKLACSPNPPPSKYQRVFGITSMFESNDSIIARLSRTLAASSQESLQQWKEPFVHLGGSGTFYPVPEIDRSSDLMPKMRTGYSVGPFSAEVSQVQDLIEDDMRITVEAFRGDFFDSNDVEGYLRARGIEIPPSADFVNVELDLSEFGEDASPTITTTTGSPRTPHNFVDNMLLVSGNDRSADDNVNFLKSSSSNLAYPQGYSNWELNGRGAHNNLGTEFERVIGNNMPGHQGSSASNSAYSQRSIVTIDVKAFVEELISRCVCLGRAPGYRPADVNKALVAAIKFGFS